VTKTSDVNKVLEHLAVIRQVR